MSENKGLINKYVISKTDGSPMPEGGEYFVLRLDDNQKDSTHRKACIAAVLKYADEIKDHLPELSRDLKLRYLPETFEGSLKHV